MWTSRRRTWFSFRRLSSATCRCLSVGGTRSLYAIDQRVGGVRCIEAAGATAKAGGAIYTNSPARCEVASISPTLRSGSYGTVPPGSHGQRDSGLARCVRIVEALGGSLTLRFFARPVRGSGLASAGDLPYEPERSEGTLLQTMSKDARINAPIRPQEDASCPQCGASKLTACKSIRECGRS